MQRRPCCSVVTGTSIFATVNCIVMGLASLVTFAYSVVQFFSTRYESESDSSGLKTFITKFGSTIMVLCFITFAFSVTLVQGVFQKKPALIKTYFFYGVSVLVVCMLSNVILIAFSKDLDLGEISPNIDVNKLMFAIELAVSIICIIYTAILAMIWSTYKEITKEIMYEYRMFNENKY